MCAYKMHKKFKFCIDTRHFECPVYWFDIEYVIKDINEHKLNIDVSHTAIHSMAVPTIDKDHLVMNISECFLS